MRDDCEEPYGIYDFDASSNIGRRCRRRSRYPNRSVFVQL